MKRKLAGRNVIATLWIKLEDSKYLDQHSSGTFELKYLKDGNVKNYKKNENIL